MIKAIIFDCFWVIITDALQAIVSEFGEQNPERVKEIVEIVHANNRGLLVPDESNRRIGAILGITADELRNNVIKGEVKDQKLLDYVLFLRNNRKTALLSNVGVNSIQRRFSDEETKKYFDTVVISGEIGLMKPDPEIYLYTAKKLGVLPSECVFVDDRATHCKGAEAVGMQSILYTNLPQFKQELEKVLSHS